MSLILPKIYAITDRQLSGLDHAEQVKRLIDGGATLIQLREKRLSSGDFLREAEAAWRVANDNHVALIINDRVDIAIAIDATGVHLGQDDLPIEAARPLMTKPCVVGYSTHTLEQIKAAARFPITYLAFGPVFATGTKPEHEPVVGLNRLREAKQISNHLPLVAIGGITAANVREVLEAGADSVAVISAVVGDPGKITQNMQRILHLAND